MEVSASSQTRRCSLEVPLDAARLGMTCRARGKRGKRWAAEMVSLATERLSPPPIFSLPLIRRRTSFRRRRQEVAESHPRQGTICRKRRTMVARLDREEGSRAGRSTAGLGGGEAVRQVEHAVSVRARFALFCETRRQILTIHKDNCKIETHILLIDSPIRNFGKHLTNAVLCCIFADKKSSTSKRN